MNYDVIIIGSGAAGLSASIYLARAGIKTLVLGDQKRSQLTAAFDIKNLFGFPEGITGTELLKRGNTHAKKSGATLLPINAKKITKTKTDFKVELENNETHNAKYLIIATGQLSSLDFASSLKLKMNGKQIMINENNQTSEENVYAAGNCTTKTRQIAKDIGDGCNAAINIIKKIKNLSFYNDYGPIDSDLGPS